MCPNLSNQLFSRHFPQSCLLLTTLAAIWIGDARPASAYDPKSPIVRAMLAKAAEHLEQNGGNEIRLGGKCLIGLALYKHSVNEDRPNKNHPLVQRAVQACKDYLNGAPTTLRREGSFYSIGIAIMFLGEVGRSYRNRPNDYAAEMQGLLEHMVANQQPGGAWSYFDRRTGDTSQTQYGVLALWSAEREGLQVSLDSQERVCNWLLRTQDLSGGWGYQGRDPGNMTRVQQAEVSLSLSAAGLSSVYICADMLGFGGEKDDGPQQQSHLPAALRRVGARVKKTGKGPWTTKVTKANLNRAMSDGEQWFGDHYQIKARGWSLYYLYGLERYKSFQELYEYKGRVANADWYDDGVQFLSDTQRKDGSWRGDNTTPSLQVDTSFGMLFLLRSAKSMAPTLEGGVLVSGSGLPKNVANIRMSGGQVLGTPEAQSVGDVLAMAESADSEELAEALKSLNEVKWSSDQRTRTKEVNRLRQLVSARSVDARVAAVRMLGRTRNLDNVPILLHALNDRERRVVIEARDALRFISRRFDGFGLPDTYNPAQIRAAKKNWRLWLLSIRPDAQFLD